MIIFRNIFFFNNIFILNLTFEIIDRCDLSNEHNIICLFKPINNQRFQFNTEKTIIAESYKNVL